jgi:hypothetical protein
MPIPPISRAILSGVASARDRYLFGPRQGKLRFGGGNDCWVRLEIGFEFSIAHYVATTAVDEILAGVTGFCH